MKADIGRETEFLIIGAGMAGLAAASAIRAAGREVVVLDKGRGIGGRLASRRIGGATFDHGAQFITARDPRFVALIESLRQEGLVEEWCRGFPGDGEGHSRWRGHPAMTAVPKKLAAGIGVILEQQVERIFRCGSGWEVESRGGGIFRAKGLILTPPVPQSLAILEAGEVGIAPEMMARLGEIEYERCLSVMAVLAAPSRVPEPGGHAPDSGPVAWIADNRMKGISSEPAVTIHATPSFSLERWDEDRMESGSLLLEAAGRWLGGTVVSYQVHGWRYARPVRLVDGRCVVIRKDPPLVMAGDAFAGPKVEGAARSGWAAAEEILKLRG